MLGLRAGWSRTSARLEAPFLVSTEGLGARKCVNMLIDQTFPPVCTQPRPSKADRSSCPRGNVCPLPLQPRDPQELLLSCKPASAAPGELPPSFSASGACTQERGQRRGTVKPVRAHLPQKPPAKWRRGRHLLGCDTQASSQPDTPRKGRVIADQW